MQSSVPLVMTLHSRSGSVKHVYDPNDPNRVKIRQPTLMMSLIGSAGCIRDSSINNSNLHHIVSKKTLTSKLSNKDTIEEKEVH